MHPKYKIIIKEGETYSTHTAETLTFLTNKGLPVVSASYYKDVIDADGKKDQEKVAVIIDEYTSWLYQSTNAFDRNGKLIYHGDLLKDEQGILYEVMYAVGSYFIVKDDAPLMLLDEHVRKLVVVGNIIENYDLIKVDATPLEAVADKV